MLRLHANQAPTVRHEFHHGDCVGADSQASVIAGRLGFRIVLHPPLDPKKRAYNIADLVLQARPYLERNHDIVDACDVMFATPREMHEVLRSGTWATIRYARKCRKDLLVIQPERT